TTPETGDKISSNMLSSFINLVGTGFAVGIQLEHASQNTIAGNSVLFPRSSGIDLNSCDSNTVSSNTVIHSGEHMSATGVGISLEDSNGNMLSKNVANDNEAGGIELGGATGSSGNTLKQNTASLNDGFLASGIALAGGTQNKLLGNIANFNA